MVASVTAALLAVRRRQLGWGATTHERTSALPGDELVPNADLVATRSIAINATPDDIWPWIAQLGQDRGGFYSYDRLESVVVANIHSVDRVVADRAVTAVGDAVHLAPEVALEVAVLEPGRALVLRTGTGMGPLPAPYDFTWAFVIVRAPDGRTRLVVRERYRYRTAWAGMLVEPLTAVSFVMSRKMLRGIRVRAEAASQQQAHAAAPTPPAPAR